jgi:hypothetical protein
LINLREVGNDIKKEVKDGNHNLDKKIYAAAGGTLQQRVLTDGETRNGNREMWKKD